MLQRRRGAPRAAAPPRPAEHNGPSIGAEIDPQRHYPDSGPRMHGIMIGVAGADGTLEEARNAVDR